MDKSERTEPIKDLIEIWKKNNRSVLPVNINTWQITIRSRNNDPEAYTPARLGKYHSERATAISFYKSISRLINPPQHEY